MSIPTFLFINVIPTGEYSIFPDSNLSPRYLVLLFRWYSGDASFLWHVACLYLLGNEPQSHIWSVNLSNHLLGPGSSLWPILGIDQIKGQTSLMSTITRSCGITIGASSWPSDWTCFDRGQLGYRKDETTILITDRITFCLHSRNQFALLLKWVSGSSPGYHDKGIMFAGDHDPSPYFFDTIVGTIIAGHR